MLCKGFAGAGDIGFLEHVTAEQLRIDLPCDGHERDAVHIRRGNAGDEVRRAGAGGGDAHAGLAARTGIPAGRVGRVLLLAHQDMPDVGLVKEIIEWADRRAGITEGQLYALKLQTFYHDFCAADHGAPSFPQKISVQAGVRAICTNLSFIIVTFPVPVKTLSR